MIEGNVVEIVDCYTVAHSESGEDGQVRIFSLFYKNFIASFSFKVSVQKYMLI